MKKNDISERSLPLGNIPNEWAIVELSELGEIVTGTTPSTNIKDYWGEGYLFVTPTDFNKNKYVHKTERTVTKSGAEKGRIIPKDSIMVVCIASVGEVAMASTQCITNQQINTIVCNKGLNQQYIYYSMVFSKNRLKRWAGITTSPIVKKSLFEKFPLPIPRSIEEQRKIAEIISTVDEAIQTVDEAIGKTQRLKKGLMQELLTKGIGHKEFKETEIGRMPKEWEAKNINELGTLQYGITKTAKKENTGIKFLRITDITDEGIQWNNVPYCEVTKNEFEKYGLKVNDILFARIGATTGKTCYAEKTNGSVYGSYLLRFQPFTDGIDTKYLFFYTQSLFYWRQIQRVKGGQLKGGLNTKLLGNIRLPFPSLSEQQKISEILSAVDKKMELLRDKKAKFERIKQGLMNDLLTGKKRVKVEA